MQCRKDRRIGDQQGTVALEHLGIYRSGQAVHVRVFDLVQFEYWGQGYQLYSVMSTRGKRQVGRASARIITHQRYCWRIGALWGSLAATWAPSGRPYEFANSIHQLWHYRRLRELCLPHEAKARRV